MKSKHKLIQELRGARRLYFHCVECVFSKDARLVESLLSQAANMLETSEPVVHAHWVAEWRETDWGNPMKVYACSNCKDYKGGGYGIRSNTLKYCPNCGAKMDE